MTAFNNLLLLLLLSRFSHVRLLAIPWTAAYQASPSMGFSRQEYWSGLPLPSPLTIWVLESLHKYMGIWRVMFLYNWSQWLSYQFSSVHFSRSVVSNSLQPHEPQHARPPCPSPTPGVHPNPCPLSRWCHPPISSSVVPFSSCLQSFPTSGSFQMKYYILNYKHENLTLA